MAAFNRHVVIEMTRGMHILSLNQLFRNSIGLRTLYTESALGVDNYIKTRERIQSQFQNMSDKFRTKMNEFSEPSSTNMIFTEDLKNMIHLVDTKSNDVPLVIKMMKRFNEQNKELRFGNYVFGPVVMRMFYHLNEPQAALDAFNTKELDGFFDQLISYQVLMDLLFKNEMYTQIIDVMNTIKGKQMQDAKYPKNVVLLTFAACYKMNSPESLKYAMELWRLLQEVGHTPLRRATTFAAALAIKQNSPHIAIEIISSLRQQSYVTVRNLKLAALADIGRPEDSLPILRSVLEADDPAARKQTFSQDVMTLLAASFAKTNNSEASREFQQLAKTLGDNGHITDIKLEDHLLSEISPMIPTNNQQGRDRRFLAASFTRQEPDRSRNFDRPRSFNRPGLQDLH